MSQAEIAGGVFTPPDEFPSKGHLLRDFSLTTATGKQIDLSDYRSHSNLVLILADDENDSSNLLHDVARGYAEIRLQEAEVLAVVLPGGSQTQDTEQQPCAPYPVLIDNDGRLHARFGAMDAQGRACSAVYIADRFVEIFGVYRKRDGQSLPTAQDIVSWLEFVNSQCPECEPPEWPV